MSRSYSDPGYGDPSAPPGTEGWAKRWRLDFQGVAKQLPENADLFFRYFEEGRPHRAWELLNKDDGTLFRTFDEFCEYRQPWGLAVSAAVARTLLEGMVGKTAADLVTVPPSRQGERTDTMPERTSLHDATKCDSRFKDARLRAILRAPDAIQDLYRDGLVSQTTAASLGPKNPPPEKAAKVAEAREAVGMLERPLRDAPEAERREFRRRVDRTVREVLGQTPPKPADVIRRLWAKLDPTERAALLAELARA